MNYEQFNDETKLYYNKVMDIYFTIMDKPIEKELKNLFGETKYAFLKFDKKILSLYIAAFLADGNLKNILKNYDDIKINDLLSFIDINIDEIKKLDETEYSNFYNENFKYDLLGIKDKYSKYYILNEMTPEVIFSFLQDSYSLGSNILKYLAITCKFSTIYLSEHPSFIAVENFAREKGSLKEKTSEKDDDNYLSSSLFTPRSTNSLSRISLPSLLGKEEVKQDETKEVPSFDEESAWSKLSDIQSKFIGQETLVEHLFYNIVNNQQLAINENINDGERSIIFLDGPTGTGKTAITREITEQLDIPFIASSATNYSATGYVGGNITDTLKELYEKADGNLEKAQKGIIVFDEFDKITHKHSGSLEMKKAVQQQLLDFMGGGKYKIRVRDGLFDKQEVEFDTSKLTFVCLSALSELRDFKTQKKQALGFGEVLEQSNADDYSITPQDLIDMGLERELVGRFNTYLHTDEYSEEDLLKILKESPLSPLKGLEKLVSSKGKKLEIADGVYEVIASAAYKLHTGARSLQTIVNNIRTHFLKDILRGEEAIIYLDKETVINITESTFNRKGRR